MSPPRRSMFAAYSSMARRPGSRTGPTPPVVLDQSGVPFRVRAAEPGGVQRAKVEPASCCTIPSCGSAAFGVGGIHGVLQQPFGFALLLLQAPGHRPGERDLDEFQGHQGTQRGRCVLPPLRLPGLHHGVVFEVRLEQHGAGLTDPVAQYDHDESTAIICGYVYRGTAMPALSGHYVFGDTGAVQRLSQTAP
jgi:hypothetical protein